MLKQFITLSETEYAAKITDAAVLAKDKHGDKVLRLADGNMLKLFRVKRLWSSAQIFPYAKRFADNTERLKQKQIKTVECLALFRIPHIQRTAIEYQPLLGTSLRDIAKCEGGLSLDVIRSFAEFIALLHEKGIYFRSLHLGNVLLLSRMQFGIIDCADMKIRSNSLSARLRFRNFAHLMRYPRDVQYLVNTNTNFFIEHYLANLPNGLLQKLARRLKPLF